MRIRRDIASIPARSAAETWRTIIDLVTGKDSIDKQQLVAASSIMESLIADEQPANVAIQLSGSGPRILIYCVYNEGAMEAGLKVDSLPSNPTDGAWRMTAPCANEDIAWMNNALKVRAPRISVHSADDKPVKGDDEEASAKPIEIDWGAFGKP